jgi:hypothetical protein
MSKAQAEGANQHDQPRLAAAVADPQQQTQSFDKPSMNFPILPSAV